MNKHRIWTLVATLAMAGTLALAGCEKRQSDDKKTSQTAPTDESATAAEQAQAQSADESGAARPQAGALPTVKLVEAGAEPRRELRYTLAEGSTETMVMTMDTTIQTKIPDMEMPDIKIPTMTMHMDMVMAERVGDDRVRYDFVLSEAKATGGPAVMPQVVELTQTALDQAKGMKGSAFVDSRGFNYDVSMELPATMDPQMRQMMEGTFKNLDQMSSPLPAEPVGKGAKWELHQQIEQNGMKVDQVTLFELVELEGNKGRMTAQIAQKAGRQKVEMPGMTGGSAELVGLQSSGTGELSIDLDRLVPTSSISLTSDYTMEINAMGQSQTIDAHLEMSMRIDSK